MSKMQAITDLHIRSGPGLEYAAWDVLEKGQVAVVPDMTGWTPIEMEDGSIGFASATFLQPAPEDANPNPPAPPSPVEGEPLWITWAKQKATEKVKEVPGSGDNPEIVSWYQYTTLPKSLWHDLTAWCAVFVNAALFKNGKVGDKSALAADFLHWGINSDDNPQLGDVAVFDWGEGPHHVAFVLSVSSDRVKVVGGNQGDAVTITSYPISNVAGFRRPA